MVEDHLPGPKGTTVSRIASEDPRELIPEEGDRTARLEALLVQALEENKLLKKKLQSDSASS